MKKLFMALTVLAVAGAFVFPATALADNHEGSSTTGTSSSAKEALCDGLNIVSGEGCGDRDASDDAIQRPVRTVIQVLSLIVGIVAVIMVIIGGLKYITSGGDSASVTSAKNTILYAVIGLVIVAMAQIIVRFVLNRAGS